MAMMEAGAIQLWAFKASENQYPNMVHADHVRLSKGVTSKSMLDLHHGISEGFTRELFDRDRGLRLNVGSPYQSPSSAKEVLSRGRTHPDSLVLVLRSALTRVARSRRALAMSSVSRVAGFRVRRRV